jgi:glycosyltransferase involved in cell wall biosynthesis
MIPQVTIVIPTYRRPVFLRRALKSALAQTFTDFEVHVCDDASGDETRTVVEEFSARDSRVKYFVGERNVGMLANFIRSMTGIKTPFFTMLDDDDLIFPDFLKSGMAALERFTEAPLFCGLLLHCTEDGRCVGAPAASVREGLHSPPALMKMIRSQTLNAVIFRTELLRETGGLDPEIDSFDTNFLWRIAVRWPIILGHQVSALHFLYEASHNYQLSREVPLNGLRRMYLNAANSPNGCAPASAAHLRRIISGSYIRMALQAIDAGEFAAAAEAGRILQREMDRKVAGLSLERLAGSPRALRLFVPLLRMARGWLGSSRERRCSHYNPVIKQTLAALA